MVLVDILSQGIFECQIHIGSSCSLHVELGDTSLYLRQLMLLFSSNHKVFVHDTAQGLYHEPMVVILELTLMILAVNEQVLEQILE